jgi:hypothetical protein
VIGRLAMLGLLVVGCGGIGDAQKRLRTAIDANQDRLDTCYAKSLERDAEGKGSMVLVLRVTDTGELEEVTVNSSEVTDRKLEKCVKAALMKVKLEPAPDGAFEVEYTFDFTPES